MMDVIGSLEEILETMQEMRTEETEEKQMEKTQSGKIYITITGMNFYYGHEWLEAGMQLKLVKDPDNEHDPEAIKAEAEALGKIGYVANSPRTVLGECMSAGRLYDKMGDEACAVVKYVLPQGVVCEVKGEEEDK